MPVGLLQVELLDVALMNGRADGCFRCIPFPFLCLYIRGALRLFSLYSLRNNSPWVRKPCSQSAASSTCAVMITLGMFFSSIQLVWPRTRSRYCSGARRPAAVSALANTQCNLHFPHGQVRGVRTPSHERRRPGSTRPRRRRFLMQ